MQPFRFAVLGAGEIATFYMSHFQQRKDKENAEYVGACELVEERGKSFIQRFGGEYFPTMDAMLSRKDIDGVIILTMPGGHAPLTKQCLQAGKHVHVEKPLGTTLEAARECVEIANAKGLKLSCSPFIALGEAQQKIKALLNGGEIGKPLVATADMYHGRLEQWHPAPAHFYKASGGPMRDVGPYPLTVLIDWLGAVKKVQAMCITALPDRVDANGKPFSIDVYDHATLLLTFASGAMGRIDISNVNIRSALHGMEIHCSGGSLSLSNFMDFRMEWRTSKKDASKWEHVEGDPTPKPASGVDWSTGIMELAGSVREDRQPRCSGPLALHVLQVLLAAEESAKKKCEVDVKLILPLA